MANEAGIREDLADLLTALRFRACSSRPTSSSKPQVSHGAPRLSKLMFEKVDDLRR